MGKLKKLRRQSEKLSYRVQIIEQQQRLAELQRKDTHSLGFHKHKEH